ncbi:hypothetical protein ACH5RR_023142 [Cinchona calisaya]|uniref:Uncharacterized protein n=1 Tax=Cinchona calisaya TaxID=153742 RepID=A0ABD2ZD93_9GENT
MTPGSGSGSPQITPGGGSILVIEFCPDSEIRVGNGPGAGAAIHSRSIIQFMDNIDNNKVNKDFSTT